MAFSELDGLWAEIITCRACPRLVTWRDEVARVKRASFANQTYWGRPIPSFGDPAARVLVVGLAPAAHGGNRTGRMFTGDRSGEWLYGALFRTGFANQGHSEDPEDGLELTDLYIGAAVRCAPPSNKPSRDERNTCLRYLIRELRLLENVRVIVALGSFAWDAAIETIVATGAERPRPKPRFGHQATADVGSYTLVGSYHPSQQNTFTGKLTEEMLDAVFLCARELAVRPGGSARASARCDPPDPPLSG